MQRRFDEKAEREIGETLKAAGGDCHAVRRAVQEYVAQYGCTPHAVYKAAQRQGWTSGRKPRADRGARKKAVTDTQIEAAARLIHSSHTEKNRIPTPAWRAIKTLEQSGIIEPGLITPAYLNQELRKRNLSKRAALARTPHARLMTEYPNQVHLVDASQCAQWYLDNMGAVEHQARDFEIYKNKEGKPTQITRLLCVDHYSGAFIPWYTDKRESAAAFIEFLIFVAWAPKSHVAQRVAQHLTMSPEELEKCFPFRGMPELLYSDKGPGLKAAAMQSMLEALGVQQTDHLPGNSRAKGGNETMQGHWERAFECELKDKPATSLPELQARGLEFAAWYNAERTLTRARQPRFRLWVNGLRAAQIPVREIPDPEFVRSLALLPEEKRRVDMSGIVLYTPPKHIKTPEGFSGAYRVPKEDVDFWGEEVAVRWSVLEPPNLVVRVPKLGKQWILSPLPKNEAGFYPTISPVLGKEFKAAPSTSREIALAALDAHAPTPADRERRKLARPRSADHAPAAPPNLIVSVTPKPLDLPEVPSVEFQVPRSADAVLHIKATEAKGLVLEILGVRSHRELTPPQQDLFRDITGSIPRNDVPNLAARIAALAPPPAPILTLGGQS